MACNEQLSSLPAYRSAVASVINRVARAYAGVDIPRGVNRAYLQFFLPFWWEHILERGRLVKPAAEKQVTLILSPRTIPAPAAAAVPIATAQPAAPPHPTSAPWPYPPPPAFHFLPPHMPLIGGNNFGIEDDDFAVDIGPPAEHCTPTVEGGVPCDDSDSGEESFTSDEHRVERAGNDRL